MPSGDDANKPQVIFETVMSKSTSREQEDALVAQFFKRYQELGNAMGRDQIREANWWNGLSGMDDETMSFLAKRQLFEMVYYQKMQWRKYVLGGIYEMGQNVHMPYTFQIVNAMIARANNYFFETSPYFAVRPMPGAGVDTTKASQADTFVRFKLDQAGVVHVQRKANEKAFIRGECTIKTRHWTDAIRYETETLVMVESPGGDPVVANDNDYIYPSDQWEQRPLLPPEVQTLVDQMKQGGNDPAMMGVDLSQYPVATTLKRDPTTALTQTPIFEKRTITRTLERYKGPEAAICHPADFIYPLDAVDYQKADCIIHVYDIPAIQIVQMYIDRLKAQGTYDPKEFPKLLNLLRSGPISSHGQTQTIGAGARPELGESNVAGNPNVKADPALNIAEAYLTYDINNDGQYEEIFMMIDLTTKRPIIYDHLPNVFPDGKRPFHMIAINQPDGRCHGTGMVEIFWELQKFMDLMIARQDFGSSQNGSVTFWHPELTEEGAGNPNLIFNDGGTYRKKDPSMPAERIVERIPMNTYEGPDIEKLTQLTSQMMTTMSGVANTNDGEMAGLDQTKLATGIKNLEQSGEERFKPFLAQLQPGHESVLEALTYSTIAHADPVEEYHVLEGDKLMPMAIDMIDVRHLQFEVSLEMTRYRGSQQIAESQAALALITQFYNQPLQLQQITLPFFKAQLRAYGTQDVDSILQPGLVQMMPPPPGKGAPPAAQGPDGAPAGQPPQNPPGSADGMV